MIPREISWRNDDYHLIKPEFAALCKADDISAFMEIENPKDVSFDMRQFGAQDGHIQDVKLLVFKFAVQFYYTI